MMLLPLILVVASTILSLVYKYYKEHPIKAAHLSKPTIAHAFIVEAIQLALAIIGSIISCATLLLSPTLLYNFKIANFDLSISTWLAAIGTLAIYALAILTIDVIDSLIQLGSWRHPIQVQTLLLTRSVLLPSTVIRQCFEIEESPRGRSRTPKALTASFNRAASEPATPTRLRDIGVQFSSETRNALVKVRSTSEREFSTPSVVRGGVGRRTAATQALNKTVASPLPVIDLKKQQDRTQETHEVLQSLHEALQGQYANSGQDFAPENVLGTPSPTSTKRSHSASLPSVPSSIGSIDVEKTSASWDNVTLGFGGVTPAHARSPPSFGSSSASSELKIRPRPRGIERDGEDTQGRVVESGSPSSRVRSVSGSMVKETAKLFEQKV